MTRTTVSSGLGSDASPDSSSARASSNTVKGNKGQTEIKMALLCGVGKEEEKSIPRKNKHNPDTVCFVIHEESEPSSSSGQNSVPEKVEETVKCDFVVKYKKRVKRVTRSECAKSGETFVTEKGVNQSVNLESSIKYEK